MYRVHSGIHRKIPGITLIMNFAKIVDFERKISQIRSLKIHEIQPTYCIVCSIKKFQNDSCD